MADEVTRPNVVSAVETASTLDKMISKRTWYPFTMYRTRVFRKPDWQIRLPCEGRFLQLCDEVIQVSIRVANADPRQQLIIRSPGVIVAQITVGILWPHTLHVGVGKLFTTHRLVRWYVTLVPRPVLVFLAWVERVSSDPFLEVIFRPWQIGLKF